jgi:hypothetical protein
MERPTGTERWSSSLSRKMNLIKEAILVPRRPAMVIEVDQAVCEPSNLNRFLLRWINAHEPFEMYLNGIVAVS